MVHLEMRLNYADEMLRMSPSGFKNKGKKFEDLYNLDQKLWDSVLKEYQALFPQKKKVMAHYWNPTNYNNSGDLIIPIELSDPAIFPHDFDNIDELYNLARGSYPFEINVKTRWFKN